MNLVSRPRQVWLVRHPQTDWNLEKRYQGISDRPLSTGGLKQMESLVAVLRELDPEVVFSSPRSHALELAQELERCTDARLVLCPEISEIDHGVWEGLTHQEVLERHGAHLDRFENTRKSKLHAGESLEELLIRLEGFVCSLMEQMESRFIVVSHATPIRLLISRAAGAVIDNYWRFQIDNASISKLEMSEDYAIVCFTNERSCA